jgi:hypothetical protein
MRSSWFQAQPARALVAGRRHTLFGVHRKGEISRRSSESIRKRSLNRLLEQDAQYALPAGARERAGMSWTPPDEMAPPMVPKEPRPAPQRASSAREDFEAAMQLQALSGSFSPYSSPTTPFSTQSMAFPSSSSSGSSMFGMGSSSSSNSYPFPPTTPNSASLEKASKRLSGLSMEEKEPSPASSSGSSSRMDLASLINRPSSRNSSRRLSFSGASRSSSASLFHF